MRVKRQGRLLLRTMNRTFALRLIVLAGLTVLCGCGTNGTGSQASSRVSSGDVSTSAASSTVAPAASATPAPIQTALTTTPDAPLGCTPSGPASAAFPPAASAPATPGIRSAAVAGDTFTLTFPSGTPAFQVMPQPTSHFFVGDGRGENVNVAGSAGAIIVLTGFRGDLLNYTGPADLSSRGPELLEVRHVNEFEGVVHWAVGLKVPGCANVTASGSTLTFRFIPLFGKG